MNEPTLIKDRVSIRIEHDIAYVTLQRSDKLNALDMPMFEAISAAAKKVSKDKSLRAVIISGSGKAFCSGLDVKSMFQNPLAMVKLLIQPGTKAANLAQDVSYLWRKCPIPVIAVTHGKCWGGGFQIALGADFRYSTPDCEFSIMEARWGLIPDMAGSIALRELAPIDVIKELAMTGRVFNGEEAKAMGLVTHVHQDPMAAAEAFVEEIKQRSPDAVASTKQLFTQSWSGTIKQALNWETRLQRKLIGRKNQRVAVARSSGKGPEKAYEPRA